MSTTAGPFRLTFIFNNVIIEKGRRLNVPDVDGGFGTVVPGGRVFLCPSRPGDPDDYCSWGWRLFVV